jgi:hypothetical protein
MSGVDELRRVSTDGGRLTYGVVTVTGCCADGALVARGRARRGSAVGAQSRLSDVVQRAGHECEELERTWGRKGGGSASIL